MTTETAEQKNLRREVSGKVTKVLNTVSTKGVRLPGEAGLNDEIGSKVRQRVLLALQKVDDKIKMLERGVQADLNLTVTQGQLIKFYMKGGNAYSCIVGDLQDIQNARYDIGGGDSDWDTQVVINPWLPSPIRTRLHHDVIEVTLSEFRQCAEDIAHIVHGYNIDTVLDLDTVGGDDQVVANDNGEVKAGKYVFVMDGQQTTRKIMSYDNLGMVFDDRVAISPASGTDKKDGPGILLHAAIKPFELYRLGYLGKVYRLNNHERAAEKLTENDYDETSLLPRKALAELIDITIPRLDTIEAFEVWESLESNHISITYENVGVRNIADASVPIPLPNINYHKLENLLMLCEMADGSSRHYNKLHKRVRRLREACEAEEANTPTPHVKQPMLHMVGVAQENQLLSTLPAQGTIDVYLNANNPDGNNYHAPNSWYAFIRSLMIHINVCVAQNQANLLDHTWQQAEHTRQQTNTDNNEARSIWASIYNNLKSSNNTSPLRVGQSSTANMSSIQRYRSDDLALLDQLQATGATSHDVNDRPIVNASLLRPSTITHWRILRLDDRDSMLKVFATFNIEFNLKKSTDSSFNFIHRFYTREDERGHIPECLVIAKKGEKILSVCTLIVGGDARTGHSRMSSIDLGLGKNTVAVLSDIARQRKLTAALTHDYTLKSILSQHYEIIKQLIKVD